ncbi:hypothetical protein COX05_01415 [candidate division WWE3 bacterium CG22_combo_CG10-13_8_21_14_all_39_12]|uniref:Uncharacterized protein n=1 Tax=candidate division WWE3 bacterium CG22_combo_CG10-13_8_21_14_all_39_12 TaxID=1975094 RepID=A0A2H0BGI4_UNCKA|nr:MAG: hypothetical protein COX05_01415 [candidate division WWE3 bacterium CG22_combo_CG10-13_8_21_14_all_39_12]
MQILYIDGPVVMVTDFADQTLDWDVYTLVTDVGRCMVSREASMRRVFAFGHVSFVEEGHLVVSLSGNKPVHCLTSTLSDLDADAQEEVIDAVIEILEALVVDKRFYVLTQEEIIQLHQYLGEDKPWPPAITQLRRDWLQSTLDEAKKKHASLVPA